MKDISKILQNKMMQHALPEEKFAANEEELQFMCSMHPEASINQFIKSFQRKRYELQQKRVINQSQSV